MSMSMFFTWNQSRLTSIITTRVINMIVGVGVGIGGFVSGVIRVWVHFVLFLHPLVISDKCNDCDNKEDKETTNDYQYNFCYT